MNPLYNRSNNQNGSNSPMDFFMQLNNLKKKGGDPNQMIQKLLESGRVSQDQYNAAVQKATQLQQLLGR